MQQARHQGLRGRVRARLGVPGRAERGGGHRPRVERDARRRGRHGLARDAQVRQDRYPKLWSPRSKYFPEPVLDAQGEEVLDILEEYAQRDIDGKPCHALWIECPDREHWNYMMDRNNPVWREYLKAIVRLQIDAGVAGIHFDEAEVPLTSLQYGGCFCDTCVEGFRAYVQDLPADESPGGPPPSGPVPSFTMGGTCWTGGSISAPGGRRRRCSTTTRGSSSGTSSGTSASSPSTPGTTRGAGDENSCLGQLLQPVRALLQHRAVRRRDRHRDAEHALAIPRVVPVRGRVRWSQARCGRRETLTAAS